MNDKYIVIAVALLSLVSMVLSIMEKTYISVPNLICGIVDGFILGYWVKELQNE